MSTHLSLDPLQLPLTGRSLIEASAGTGKTFNLALLYCRCILEKDILPKDILVVTFTKAATAELKTRIRSRLIDCLTVLKAMETGTETHDPEKALLGKLLANAEIQLKNAGVDNIALNPKQVLRQRLKRAVSHFDEAAINTIHGTFQRILNRHAIATHAPFQQTLLQSEGPLIERAAHAFWAEHVQFNADRQWQAWVHGASITPEKLQQQIPAYMGKPFTHYPVRIDGASGSATITDALKHTLQEKIHTLNEHAQNKHKLEKDWVTLATSCYTKISQLKASVIAHIDGNEQINNRGRKSLHNALNQVLTNFEDLPLLPTKSKHLTPLTKLSESHIGQSRDLAKLPPHPCFAIAETVAEKTQALLAIKEGLPKQEALKADNQAATRLFLLWAATEIEPKLLAQKKEAGQFSFNDLLIHAEAVTRDPLFSAQLRQDYPVAFIDEFQDTDMLQFKVFDRIYADINMDTLIFVGDPKQAIYKFRGGDIHAYQKAVDTVPLKRRFQIDTNYRSSAAYIAAMNTLFGNCHDPLRCDNSIRYPIIQAPAEEPLTSEKPKPLTIVHIDPLSDHKVNVGLIRKQIHHWIAADIANALQGEERATHYQAILDRPPQSSDFCVLVSSHRTGESVRDALKTFGIRSAKRTKQSVFQSREARDLSILAQGLLNGNDSRFLRAAMLTPLWGRQPQDLLNSHTEQKAVSQAQRIQIQAKQLWQQRGFAAAFHLISIQCESFQYLLKKPDGERSVTNYQHLVDLIQQHSHEQGLSPHEAKQWLGRQIEAAGDEAEDNEAQQMRLESDDDLVRIETIHASKGLEYPIVYCPDLWTDTKFRAPVSYYNADIDQHEFVLDDNVAAATLRDRQDELSNAARLLYVAITRAKEACTLFQPLNYDTTGSSNWLFASARQNSNNPGSPQQKLAVTAEHLAALDSRFIETIDLVESTPSKPAVVADESAAPATLSAKKFQRRISLHNRIQSFTAMTRQVTHETTAPLPTPEDYDTHQSEQLEPVFTGFPRGSRSGVCLHSILENLDFTIAVTDQVEDIVLPTLKAYGYEQYLNETLLLLENTMHGTLPVIDVPLSHINKASRLDEMRFHFKVPQFKPSTLLMRLEQHLPVQWQSLAPALKSLPLSAFAGYLTGAIDLIFCHQGKYYIADYKSNDLGKYHADQLTAAMAEHHYPLQAMIYALALYQYLEQRMPDDFDWDQRFGGVYYLFIRGMQPDSSSGVHYARPSKQLMQLLQAAFTLTQAA